MSAWNYFHVISCLFVVIIIFEYSYAGGMNDSHSLSMKQIRMLQKSGDYEKAQEILERLENSISENTTYAEKKEIYQEMGFTKWILGNPAGAYEYFHKNKNIACVFEDRDFISLTEVLLKIIQLYNHGKESRLKGKYEESILLFEKAISLSRAIKRPEMEMKCLRQLSIDYLDQNRLFEFRQCNELALSISKAKHCQKDEGYCLNNIGLYYYRRDEYLKAIDYYNESMEIAEKTKNTMAVSECLTNVALAYVQIGEYDSALERMLRSLEMDKAANDNRSIVIGLNNVAMTFRKKWTMSKIESDLENAKKYLSEAVAILNEETQIQTKIRITENLGIIACDQEEYLRAADLFKQALILSERINDVRAKCNIFNNLGIINSRLGNDKEALECLRKAIAGASQNGVWRILSEAFLETADIQKKRGAHEDALKSYQYAIDVIEKTRSAIEDEDFKTSFWRSGRRLDMFHGAIDLLFQMGESIRGFRPEEAALECMERAKARGFLDRLEIGRVSAVQRVEARMDEQSRQIQADLSRLFQAWFSESASSAQRAAWEREIEKNEDAYESLRRKARSRDPLFSGLRFPKIVSAGELPGRILRRGTVVFTYAIGRESAYGLAITRKSRRLFRLPPPAVLRDLVTRHLAAVTDGEQGVSGAGIDLFQALLLPGFCGDFRRAVIIPDDLLYFLPFETLRRSPEAPWLGEEAEITYAPSISSLVEIAKREGRRKANPMDLLAVAFAGPPGRAGLPPAMFSEREAESIQRLYDPEKSLLLTGERASEESLKKTPLENFEIIHFAAHGLIDEHRPIRSAIVLSSGPSSLEDGLFQAREIFEIRLNAGLVVISTCRSSAGRLVRGEGLEGLNRAFMFAGASAVLTSLWPVDDEATSYLMERFHSHLRGGNTISAALRRAKEEMLATAEYAHPVYWAGFVVTGLGDQRLSPRRPVWLIPAAVALASVAAVGLAAAFRRHRTGGAAKRLFFRKW